MRFDWIRSLAYKAYDAANYLVRRGFLLAWWHAQRIRYRGVLNGQVRRILVVRLGSIGDVVRASAIVEKLRQRYPEATIDFLTTAQSLPVIDRHPALDATYTLADLDRLQPYDWIVNLQNRDPLGNLLQGSGYSHLQVLDHLSTRLRGGIVTGRHTTNGRDRAPQNILYCSSEFEDLHMSALLSYDHRQYPNTYIHVDDATRALTKARFPLDGRLPSLAIFLGSNSIGCGADEGFRTYTLDFLERLIEHFSSRFTIVVIGQSQMRNPAELDKYRQILERFPGVVNLVDKTSLTELVGLMERFALVISCDSSPIHIAIARNTPTIGLYVHEATFRIGATLAFDRFAALDSRPPCFRYSWRWKFFCLTCRDKSTRAGYCRQESFAFGVDAIPLARIDDAVDRLLGSNR